jgi:hypothetical protein
VEEFLHQGHNLPSNQSRIARDQNTLVFEALQDCVANHLAYRNGSRFSSDNKVGCP